jgi:hypothetical protein
LADSRFRQRAISRTVRGGFSAENGTADGVNVFAKYVAQPSWLWGRQASRLPNGNI